MSLQKIIEIYSIIVSIVFPNIYIHLEPQNVNLFGNGIFTDGISDVNMRLASKSNNW